jgi:hypothetical protein
MARIARACATLTVVAVALTAAAPARGSIGPKWSDTQLIQFADLIVTGRVLEIRSGFDPAVQAIYTYITVAVQRVLKGVVSERTITVKQLGGETGRRGLRVPGQAAFGVGEDVLLFLEVRPRDRTLYTAALWQGKWNLQRIGATRLAVRRHEAEADTRPLSAIQTAIDRAHANRRMDTSINTHPADAAPAIVRPYVLFNYRYNFLPVVDMQSGGQHGLAGGGIAEILASIARWNEAGSSFAFSLGSNAVAGRCYLSERFDSRVTISFMDPCGEIDDDGGTLAIGGSYYNDDVITIVNGLRFNSATEGFIVNNNSAVARSWLTRSGCFADIQLHELGHVLGLDHSSVPSSIMYPAINIGCGTGPRTLGSDDVEGLLAIYPPDHRHPPPTAPENVAVTVNGKRSVSLSFDPVAADMDPSQSAATSYRVYVGPSPNGPVLYSATIASTSVTAGIPAGISGTFYLTVAGLNNAGRGPLSVPVAFTIPCSLPLSPAGLQGRIEGGTATARWNATTGATSYVVQVGTTPGSANLFSGDIGNWTTATAIGLPEGFRAYARVIAVNACGESLPTPDVLIQ